MQPPLTWWEPTFSQICTEKDHVETMSCHAPFWHSGGFIEFLFPFRVATSIPKLSLLSIIHAAHFPPPRHLELQAVRSYLRWWLLAVLHGRLGDRTGHHSEHERKNWRIREIMQLLLAFGKRGLSPTWGVSVNGAVTWKRFIGAWTKLLDRTASFLIIWGNRLFRSGEDWDRSCCWGCWGLFWRGYSDFEKWWVFGRWCSTAYLVTAFSVLWIARFFDGESLWIESDFFENKIFVGVLFGRQFIVWIQFDADMMNNV